MYVVALRRDRRRFALETCHTFSKLFSEGKNCFNSISKGTKLYFIAYNGPSVFRGREIYKNTIDI